MPSKGVFLLLDASLLRSTTQFAVVLIIVKFAAAPTLKFCPCREYPAIFAGAIDIRSTKSLQLINFVSIIALTTTESAVSKPTIPNAALCHSQSLSSVGCGAWSVPTMSMVPSAKPLRSAIKSFSVRNGGLTLKTES